jgi:hypothetical protein
MEGEGIDGRRRGNGEFGMRNAELEKRKIKAKSRVKR